MPKGKKMSNSVLELKDAYVYGKEKSQIADVSLENNSIKLSNVSDATDADSGFLVIPFA